MMTMTMTMTMMKCARRLSLFKQIFATKVCTGGKRRYLTGEVIDVLLQADANILNTTLRLERC